MSMRHSAAMRTFAVIVAVSALAACKRDEAPPAEVFAKPGITFTITPPSAPDCKPTSVYTATLQWTLSQPEAPKLAIHVGSKTGQLMTRMNDRTGKAETGNWVAPGTWFVLIERETGEVLATVRAGPEPCP